MAIAQPSYEQFRKQRLEENKKRMEDLKLTALSQSLQLSSPKSSPSKLAKPYTPRRKEGFFFELRRSSRVAEMPAPDYKEKVVAFGELPRRSYGRSLLGRVYASDEVRLNAIDRAEAVHSNLEGGFPTFLKPMLQSHVTGGFWLGLPVQFCKQYLPESDSLITLEDEEGNEHTTKYLPRKTGLSGGWKGFAMSHDLVDGDALVFQLVRSTRFKVYIIRANGPSADNDTSDICNEEPDAKRTKIR